MAVPTGSGTETVHSGLFEDIISTPFDLITGVQHHVYTVLSVIVCCRAVHASANQITFKLVGYDSKAGASGENIILALWDGVLNETFVFNDKFSFNGYEPDANTQIARAAQAGSAAQKLQISTEDSSCKIDVAVTYIDQDFS